MDDNIYTSDLSTQKLYCKYFRTGSEEDFKNFVIAVRESLEKENLKVNEHSSIGYKQNNHA